MDLILRQWCFYTYPVGLLKTNSGNMNECDCCIFSPFLYISPRLLEPIIQNIVFIIAALSITIQESKTSCWKSMLIGKKCVFVHADLVQSRFITLCLVITDPMKGLVACIFVIPMIYNNVSTISCPHSVLQHTHRMGLLFVVAYKCPLCVVAYCK